MSKITVNRHPWTLPQAPPKLDDLVELPRPGTRPSTSDFGKPAAKTLGRAELAKRKTELFEEAFAVRGSSHPVRERIRGDSIVLLELKTNVIIGDEFIFITELSAKLAELYQRPLSAIAVHVQHSQCIFFAGTFEPAYTVTLSALSSYILPATNRRNAYVLSEHLEEALGVPQPRGFISFLPIPEENVACNGKTIAAALDDASENPLGYTMGVIDEDKSATFGSRRRRLSVKSLANIRTPSAAAAYEMTPPTSAEDNTPMAEVKPAKVAKRRKSFVAGLFGWSNGRKENEKQAAEGI
ncbi:hypothetical protein N0V93_005543 [Gnomoniopsis smithogilvyi]|uniref:L-dopachrome isomerase n=1 Tax=Gnomoniopsis smithogilvyi TaxID=1191159 RepID=A0A9W9CX86_9PEZI|nr:hypothetical protein N0V93_005543 [Gnomoniopsis smithogilvyi]